MGSLFRDVSQVYAVRAIAGHSQPHVDGFRAGKALTREDVSRLPFMVHGGYLEDVPLILAHGLSAGGRAESAGHTGRNDVMCAGFPLRDPRCRSGMRKDSGRRGRINCQIYLDADRVALVRRVCLTATGGLLVRGDIPANCILGITEVYPDRRGHMKESPVWIASVRHCVPWYVVKMNLRSRAEDWALFPGQPTAPVFTRGTPGSAGSDAPTIQQYGTDPSTIAANFIGSTPAKAKLDLRVFRCPSCAPLAQGIGHCFSTAGRHGAASARGKFATESGKG